MDFIPWHRTMVPSRYNLYLFKSSSWDSLELLPNTTQQQLEATTGRPS